MNILTSNSPDSELWQENGSIVFVEEWAEAGNLWELMAAAGGGKLTEQQV